MSKPSPNHAAATTEGGKKLPIKRRTPGSLESLFALTSGFKDVCVLRLPAILDRSGRGRSLKKVGQIVADIGRNLDTAATLVVIGEVIDLLEVATTESRDLHFHHWVAIKQNPPPETGNGHLPEAHFGALIYTRYDGPLIHVPTRIPHTFCPACGNTSRDYGGKRQLSHDYGPLISDVWRDITCELGENAWPAVERFAQFFAVPRYGRLLLIDCSRLNLRRVPHTIMEIAAAPATLPSKFLNQILTGDCIKQMRKIPDNTIDFVFCDPPYNLKKVYLDYEDDMQFGDYFDWCGRWLLEIARVLKPGCTCAILNIPGFSAKHFLPVKGVFEFQNWIAWDALAFPVRKIMPAHYAILCLTKGQARDLPGFSDDCAEQRVAFAPPSFKVFESLSGAYCIRPHCVAKRNRLGITGHVPLTDMWADIHRVRHNCRRVDHPCQLPPHFMYRLISLFTHSGEIVMDCFNGAGTTTLAAHQLGRRYIGIEQSEEYCRITRLRHSEVERGIDPFRKEKRVPSVKNSPGPRIAKRNYDIPKKTLQIEVCRVAKVLGHIPDRKELAALAQFPIKYYDKYFTTWAQVSAAARAAGFKRNVNRNRT